MITNITGIGEVSVRFHRQEVIHDYVHPVTNEKISEPRRATICEISKVEYDDNGKRIYTPLVSEKTIHNPNDEFFKIKGMSYAFDYAFEELYLSFPTKEEWEEERRRVKVDVFKQCKSQIKKDKKLSYKMNKKKLLSTV